MESWDSSAHDIAAIGSPHHNYNSAMVLAVPHGTGAKQKNMHNPSDYVHVWDNDSENSSSKDPENEDDSDEADNSSTQMDDWVKTLEEFDMGDGSEMLRQILLSLRQRSVMSLDRKTVPENIAAAAAAMQTRSKSTRRVESLGLKSMDGIKNPALSDLLMDLNKSVSEATNTPKISQQLDKAKSCGALYTKMSPSSVNSQKTVKPLIKPKPKCNRAKKDHIQTVFTPQPVQLQKVVLEKTSPTDDFGFSISDGLYDRGVYINAIKSDSLAEKAGLRPLDRILQVKLLFIKDSPVMELSACFHRSNVQVLQSRLQWWRSSNVPGRSNTSSTNHDPAQLWLCSTSDTSRTNNSHHQRSVCASKSMKVTSVDGNCVSITSCRSKHNTSVLHGLLLRCLPIAKCSSQKTAMDSVPHSSSVGEGQEGEGLPGVLQKKSLGQNHNTHISEQEMSQWLEKETGLDRLRMMYSLSQDGSFIHEDTRDLNTMWLTTIGLGAGVSLALAYLEQHSEQQKLLKDMQPVLQGSFRKQVHWNKIVAVSAKNTLRITVVSALLIHLSQAIAAYRNKSSIWEYAVSATLASGSLGLGHGLRHLIKRSLWGAAAGIVGGYIACKCLTDNGVNQEQKHLDWVRLHWHERKVMKQTYE